MQETLEDILYGYVIQYESFTVSKPNAADYKDLWNEDIETRKLDKYTNADIWGAALELEEKCLISIDRKFARTIAELAELTVLTPHEIIKAKLDKRKKSVTM